ncbi:MAG: ABC transporter permease [Actinomycetaceae bacterium]|nr:ABC transporter permease [Actinomycetaceae bacterium]MDY6082896.1 ABC transporter permease [Actinomycetaceae bacterium]
MAHTTLAETLHHRREQTAALRSSRAARLAATLGWTLVALLLASGVIFFTLHILPGDVAVLKAGTEATTDHVTGLRTELGLDRPLWIQYGSWLLGLLRGDLGVSAITSQPIAATIAAKLSVTVPLVLTSLLIALAASIPLGTFVALHRHARVGSICELIIQVGASIPTFLLGSLLVALFALHTGWFPATGFPQSGWHQWSAAVRSLVLPIGALTLPQIAIFARYVRSAVLAVTSRDSFRTARAQGLTVRGALRHSWRQVALPLVSVLALDVAGLMTGAVLVEQVFALPGWGAFLVTSVAARDFSVVQSMLFILSAIVILVMACASMSTAFIDPAAHGRGRDISR